jgi:transcription initiation factor IIF auxiliary subunit
MQRFIVRPITLSALVGLVGLLGVPVIYTQADSQPPTDKQLTQQSRPQKNVSDKELHAFVKAYVEVQHIKESHQTSLKSAQDPKRVEELQQETDSEMTKAIEKQGFTPEAYTQMLAAVNSDSTLKKKALDLIQKERAN